SALVLKGLITVAGSTATGKVRIELVEGDVTSATDLDVLVIPTFEDVPLAGAGAAVDRVTGNAATRARQMRRPVPVGTEAIGADFIHAAVLGRVGKVMADKTQYIKEAASETARTARHYGFSRVGIVTFLGNVAEQLAEVVSAMLAGIAGAPAQ